MADKFVEVKVEEGLLRGKEETTKGYCDVKYFAFKGVPFAKPPLGELRFKDPQPPEPWTGVRDALKTTPVAPQSKFTIFAGPVVGEEDCLYLDVYTTEIPDKPTTLKPVMFNIHGGGFVGGTRDMCTPDYMIGQGIVFVTISYRVGALGFLSLQNDEVSGNAGLKDQVLALQWVRRNIKQFGGDPDNVTLIGLSAGGASVDYLVLSELAKGLFKQAIIQSGTALNLWALNPSPREMAVQLAKNLGYNGNTKDDAELEKFLRSCSYKDIVSHQEVLGDQKILIHGVNFGPCVEKEGKGPKFITRTPRQIYESGSFNKVPIIIGHANCEGYLYFMLPGSTDVNLEKLNNNWELVVPKDIAVPEGKKGDIVRDVRKFYFDSKPVSKENLESLCELVGDTGFAYGIERSIRLYIENSSKPVYCYGFSYMHTGFTNLLIKATMPDFQFKGVPHGGDLDLLYELDLNAISNNPSSEANRVNHSDKDIQYSKMYTKMFVTFAKIGNPNYPGLDFVWEPATKSSPKYLDIGEPVRMTSGKLNEKRLDFWKEQYNKYGYLY